MVSPDGTVTVLFTDIEGSTQLTEALGDEEWIRVLRAHNALVRERVAAHAGIEVKSQGDGFMLAFATPEDARSTSNGRSTGHRTSISSACGSGSTWASRSARRTTSSGSA
ncbi:MAG TPA: adenylate/guanylate cyclase domain-containing protein [Actinomycetota bacterium]|nr:adenylate/guanylate cyclase domain-containing protein [Actinomycetota bacterium]